MFKVFVLHDVIMCVRCNRIVIRAVEMHTDDHEKALFTSPVSD